MIPFLPIFRAAPATVPGTGSGLTATYFTDLGNDDPEALDGSVFAVRTEGPLDFIYIGPGANYPHSLPGTENWAARFTGRIYAPEAGVYQFGIIKDDGVCLKIDGSTVVRVWGVDTSSPSGIIELSKGFHDFYLAYCQRPLSQAYLSLYWTKPSGGTELVPAANLFSA